MHQVRPINPLADHCELNTLLEICHPLQPIVQHHAAVITSSALSCVRKYKESVELIRSEMVSKTELRRLPLIQLFANNSSTPGEENERIHMWTTVKRYIDLDMKPSLVSLWRLEGALTRIIEIGKVTTYSVFLTPVGGYNSPGEDPIGSQATGPDVERDH